MNRKTIQSLLYYKINRLIPLILILISFGIIQNTIIAQNSESSIFQIVNNKKSVPIYYDQSDADVVGISVEALAKDIELITDISPLVKTSLSLDVNTVIIVGTVGKSKIIDKIISNEKIVVDSINGKWESFLIQVVDEPMTGVRKALVICGSDPRGTAFGVFEVSKLLGVSPWVYWADVIPEKKNNLNVTISNIIMGPPSVKYRGIFLNDEDWGLQPWAAQNMDTDIKDIGSKTYARIFELLLRLKANYIWSAMHPCTKAFFYYKENPKTAARYNILLGSSHCEPMLRNNVDEWKNNFVKEYNKQPGPWRYDTNEKEINKYWEDRVKQVDSLNVDAVFTVGMRGIHDSGLPGPETIEGKVKLLGEIIKDQRQLLSEHLGKNIEDIPQIFCPYKEVLDIYNAGAKIPDDVTIVWADDNHGYIRKLSTPEEQQRSGRSGVYYHLSYWGAPEDYLWLSSTSPALISYEMSKAYAYGADRLWVFNVGDIKPAEMNIEFAMDLAWNVNKWKPEKAHNYIEEWARNTFGKEYAKEIAEIKTVYYELAASGKPEHLNKIKFSKKEINSRLELYNNIAQKAKDLKSIIPEHLQDAYFQLILYPVLGAEKMNEKHFYALSGDSIKSFQAFDEIKKLTDIYNEEIAGGKWNGIMDMNPRERPVFEKPMMKKENSETDSNSEQLIPIKTISADEFTFDITRLHLIHGLGVDGVSLSGTNVNSPSYSDDKIDIAPFASIKIDLPEGKHTIKLICVPTHSVYEGRTLRTAIRLGDNLLGILDVNTPSRTGEWSKNVIRGYSSAKTEFILKEKGVVDLKLSLLDPGLAISKIIIY